MDIQSSPLPFSLTFHQEDKTVPVTHFFQDEAALYEQKLLDVELIENKPLDVTFECGDESARLYMDGLETLPERLVEVDEDGEVYVNPSPDRLKLFTHEYNPLIPGDYRVMIKMRDRYYFTLIRIKPKQISDTQLETMKDEVEAALKGLGQELVGNKLGLKSLRSDGLPSHLTLQFSIIQTRFPSVMAALSDLYTKVNSRIRKEYQMVSVERAKVIDEITLRHRLRHPENKETLKTPIFTTDYDLPENRWIKKIITYITRCMENLSVSIEKYRDELRAQIEENQQYDYQESTSALIRKLEKNLKDLGEYVQLASKIKVALFMIKSAQWYDQVTDTAVIAVPHVLHSDQRYRALYQLYRDLKDQQQPEVSLDKSYSYQWKRTDKLYEIWGYLKIVEVLSHQLGYQPIHGWIYNSGFNGKHILVPSLPAGTKITLKKDHIRLHLIYDGLVPSSSEETSLYENPLYTSDIHNRPDGRIDVYQDDSYMGSLVFDLKYRPRRAFWDEDKMKSSKRPNDMRKLSSYGRSFGSKFLFGPSVSQFIRDAFNPVREVWAIYPSRYETSGFSQKYEDHRLRLVIMSPGYDTHHVADYLQSVLDQIITSRESIFSS